MVEVVANINNVVRVSVGNRHYCFGTIPSDKIKELTFVPVLESSDKTYLNEVEPGGYQRPGSVSRMRAFMKFLSDNPNSVVPPVLLSARENWRFKSIGDDKYLGAIEITGRASIVDGQHRIGGFVALFGRDEDIREVSFILLEELTIEEEVEEFIVVNNTQKGVHRAQTEYLRDTEEAQISWGLNEDPDSPFHGRISRVGTSKSHLFALHSVAKQMKVLFKHGSLEELDVDKKIEFSERYFTIIADVLQEEWSDIELLDDSESRGKRDFRYKLLELTGLIAWCTVGAIILHRSHSEDTGMNWDNVKRLVQEASAIDWAKEGQYAGRTGLAGAKILVIDMERQIPAEITVNDETD
ncbi:MAG TPA: DGQHR domain-containing protein [Candidatus Melainabacteria bacterium]|nr:DGQHR domain-containing protein [Candidatus Melainabacteria bacterium]